jgi:predicted amidophosphoribosyltransferase
MAMSDEKVCPACAEPVKAAADVCKHCGYLWPDSDTAAQREAERAEARRRWYYRAFEIAVVVVGIIAIVFYVWKTNHDSQTKAHHDVFCIEYPTDPGC